MSKVKIIKITFSLILGLIWSFASFVMLVVHPFNLSDPLEILMLATIFLPAAISLILEPVALIILPFTGPILVYIFITLIQKLFTRIKK
jgi:hypothetical protein